ncbi:hypothetical protein C8Q78DRAFT_1070340 [Trametes maxima]|nr:hypothetical protein C8Q78DRAFT_1070340 [Trametes maxima]
MSDRNALLRSVLHHLRVSNVTLSELINFVITQNRSHKGPNDILFQDIVTNTRAILSALDLHPATKASTTAWAHDLMRTLYSAAVRELTDTSHGWHFGARHADPAQVRDFRLDDMAGHFERLAPDLWSLMISLLGNSAKAKKGGRADSDANASDSDQYWEDEEDEEEEEDVGAHGSCGTTNANTEDRARSRQNLLTKIKSVVIISILMNSQDQQCNALQSLTGIFLHSCGAPEKLVKVLSRMGLSIAPTSIQRAIKSMSEHSADDVEDLARTLLASYAFDNLDTKLPGGIPTVDKLQDGLIHITTGTLLRLEHGVTPEDLRCGKLLWSRSENNPSPDADPRPFDARAAMRRLLTLHREPDLPDGTLSRRGRFRKWFFIRTLLKHGPPAFSHFRGQLADPETVEAIPVKKLYQVPLRAMDINLSTVSGNLKAVDAMYVQGGVGDPLQNPSVPPGGASISDLSDYVTLVHGDLGTYEHVLAAMRRRKQERTPYNRLQPVAFVFGLFHLKMAAADGIWRMLVLPDGVRGDHTSFIKLVGKLRPNDSSRLVSNAKFRERHDLITHVGELLQLDAWRVEVRKRWPTFATLEEWAASKPKLADIEEVAECLALEYTEGDGQDISQWVKGPPGEDFTAQRDQVKENTIRTLNYLFLYEELSYAMNAGDIGRVETLFAVWIQLFRAVGKHKYANLMLRFMHALYFVYPEGLRCVRPPIVHHLTLLI